VSVNSCATSKRRILIVEDEFLIAMMLQDIVADLGFEVVAVATRPAVALEVIEHNAIDVAILDFNLGGESGRPIADALVARMIPFMFLTGCGREDIGERHHDRPLLGKPFRRNALVETLTGLS
jgi:DNA-binding response OmpR family regulator